MPGEQRIRVGTILYGFCGLFGGPHTDHYYGDKRVEAVGADWVVAREIDTGRACFAAAREWIPDIFAELAEQTTPQEIGGVQ